MKTIVITAGKLYNDIDIVACAYAYRELLRNEGQEVKIVLNGPLNNSVTEEIRTWDLKLDSREDFSNCEFIIVDVSDPNRIASFVNFDRVVEIYDHHFGYLDYWKDKLGDRAKIEFVGACATLIWEEYRKRDIYKTITPLSANLLTAAIYSNTLNFQASVTQSADHKAAEQLQERTTLPNNWITKYFNDQENSALINPREALLGDAQTASFSNLGLEIAIGQLEIWNSKKFISKNKETIKEVLRGFKNEYWFLTSPSISEGKNYFYTDDKKTKDLLQKVLGLSFEDDIAVLPRLMLRKEIKKTLIEFK